MQRVHPVHGVRCESLDSFEHLMVLVSRYAPNDLNVNAYRLILIKVRKGPDSIHPRGDTLEGIPSRLVCGGCVIDKRLFAAVILVDGLQATAQFDPYSGEGVLCQRMTLSGVVRSSEAAGLEAFIAVDGSCAVTGCKVNKSPRVTRCL